MLLIDEYDTPMDGLKPYWVNTASNDLLRDLLIRGGQAIQFEPPETSDTALTAAMRQIKDRVYAAALRQSGSDPVWLWAVVCSTGSGCGCGWRWGEF